MRTYALQNLDCSWSELEASGIPLEPMKFRRGLALVRPTPALVIRQEGDICGNTIIVFRSGVVGYMLTVFLRRDLPGKLSIRDCWLGVPWHDSRIELLPDPADDGPKNAPYKLDRGEWIYPRKEVLNHRLKGHLFRRDFREGMLLAVDGWRPPEKHREGEMIPVTLNLLDQEDHTQSERFELKLMRFSTGSKLNSKRPPLFSAEDKIDD